MKRSYLAVSAFCLLSGMVPFVGGRIALFWSLGGDSQVIGRWLAISLLGPLYAILFSLCFAGLYLWQTSGNSPLGQKLPEGGEFAS